MKLRMMINLRAIQGEMFVHVCLKLIDTSRRLFLMQIEDGDEVYIPRELSQDNLPSSFRFYDPIMVSV